MSCKYCKGIEQRTNAELFYDDIGYHDFLPMPTICSHGSRKGYDYADYAPRISVGAFDQEGFSLEVCIPINFCPICGEQLVPELTGWENQEVDE